MTACRLPALDHSTTVWAIKKARQVRVLASKTDGGLSLIPGHPSLVSFGVTETMTATTLGGKNLFSFTAYGPQ